MDGCWPSFSDKFRHGPGATCSTSEFPRQEVAARWRDEIASPDVDCLVIEEAARVVGFAAMRSAEVLHVGTTLDTWGSGLAGEVLRGEMPPHAELLVYELET